LPEGETPSLARKPGYQACTVQLAERVEPVSSGPDVGWSPRGCLASVQLFDLGPQDCRGLDVGSAPTATLTCPYVTAAAP